MSVVLCVVKLCILHMCLLGMSKFIMPKCEESQPGIHTEVRNCDVELTELFCMYRVSHTYIGITVQNLASYPPEPLTDCQQILFCLLLCC